MTATWYTRTSKGTLDLNKPICADIGTGETFLLLPTNRDNSYSFRGYNWFNPETGRYNSCADFETIEEAIRAYTNVRNCEIIMDLL